MLFLESKRFFQMRIQNGFINSIMSQKRLNFENICGQIDSMWLASSTPNILALQLMLWYLWIISFVAFTFQVLCQNFLVLDYRVELGFLCRSCVTILTIYNQESCQRLYLFLFILHSIRG